MARTARVITVSDRSARGEREDAGGPIAVAALQAAGFETDGVVIADGAASVERALRAAVADGIRVVVTTGGTGLAPRDQTPEGTTRVIERAIPGVAEELRRRSTAQTPHGMLSRGVAGTAAGTFVVNLPGSPAAVASGVPVVLSVASHVIAQLDGGDH